MHRFHLPRRLALPVRLLVTLLGALLVTQCIDSLSDDCTKTLTCGGASGITLDDQCQWRLPDGGIWAEGPRQNRATLRWEWPDGTETLTQDYRCGADGGVNGEPECRAGLECDAPRVCDTSSSRCVECLSDRECAGNLPVGGAAAANVCDRVRHECVRCLANANCSGATRYCKVDAANGRRNECVGCLSDSQCSPSAAVCDETTNECTARCASNGDCGGDRPVCNQTRSVCVACVDDTTCSGATPKCNTTSNVCVECLNDTACSAGQVCNTTSNRCVECRDDAQCAGVAGRTACDTQTNLCVACVNDSQCTAPNASRCNLVTHTCAPCTGSAQCEAGALCRVADGLCVECLSAANCALGNNRQCHPSGACVECLNSAHCPFADRAHCETTLASPAVNTCVGCTGNTDCAGKPGIGGLCRINLEGGAPGDRVCVNCLGQGDCSGDEALSFCNTSGECAPCTLDAHCGAIQDRPGCLVSALGNRCVECTNNTHCNGNPEGAVCKTTNQGAAAGPGAVNTCVECVSNANCTNPASSLCEQNVCVPCRQDAHCSSLVSSPARRVCDLSAGAAAGVCVECTGPLNQNCAGGANVCDSLQKTCTTRGVGSATECQTCVSDKECATNTRCVLRTFETDSTYSCFPINNPTCESVPFSVLTTGTIDSATQSACLLRQTTCAGVVDFGVQACATSADCGQAGVNDGVCVLGSPRGDRCSIPCTDGSDCAGGLCSGGVCAL